MSREIDANILTSVEMDSKFWLKAFWRGRKTIIIFSMISLLLETVLVIISPKEFEAKSVMVPQTQPRNARWARIGRFSGPVGLNLPGLRNSSNELSPLLYPRLVKSTPFAKELITIPLYWDSTDEEMSLFDYRKNNKPKII